MTTLYKNGDRLKSFYEDRLAYLNRTYHQRPTNLRPLDKHEINDWRKRHEALPNVPDDADDSGWRVR